jgi:hypothetical protein
MVRRLCPAGKILAEGGFRSSMFMKRDRWRVCIWGQAVSNEGGVTYRRCFHVSQSGVRVTAPSGTSNALLSHQHHGVRLIMELKEEHIPLCVTSRRFHLLDEFITRFIFSPKTGGKYVFIPLIPPPINDSRECRIGVGPFEILILRS